jgi:hypothetical protein
LRQYRKHYDWNEYFQPSSHNCPQNARFFTIRLKACRDCLRRLRSVTRKSRSTSAMGQTQTSGRMRARSVLPPTTDVRPLRQHFRLVPQADMAPLDSSAPQRVKAQLLEQCSTGLSPLR